MPQIVSCPDCGRKLKVPDNLIGKNVKCPGCGVKFLGRAEDDAIEEPEEAAPEPSYGVASRSDVESRPRRRDDDEDDDRPKSRRRRDEEEDEDYPVRKRRRDSGDGSPQASKAEVVTGWERVRFGLNMIIIAIWIAVGTGVTAVVGYLLLILFVGASFGSMITGGLSGGQPTQQEASQMAGQAAGTMTGMMVGGCLMMGILGLLGLANLACRLTGLGFCMGIASTRKTQTLKVLAIVVFCIACAGLVTPVLSFGGGALAARNGGGCLMIAGDGLIGVLALAEFICFMLFLRGVAVVMKNEDLGRNLLFYMIGTIVYFVMLPVVWFVMAIAIGAAMFSSFAASNPHNASATAGNVAGTGAAALIGGLTCFGVIALIGLALFIWYIVLLYQVRSAVDGWLDRN